MALETQRGDPLRGSRMQAERELDELLEVPPGDNGADLDGHGAGPYMADTTTDVFAKVRGHERLEQLRVAREADLLPYFRLIESPALPVVEIEGAERIMLGSNNYLGLTGDQRVVQAAHDAIDRYGTGLTGSRLLNGTTPLHLELEAELAAVDGHRGDAIVFTTGHQANVGTLGTILEPGDTVIADSADHASILDGCLLSRAPSCARSATAASTSSRSSSSGPRSDGGGVLVVVDGVFSMEGDVAPLPEIVDAVPPLRRAADGRRGARRRRARRARRGRDRAARRRGPRRPADGHVLEVARVLRRLHRRAGRRHRLPAQRSRRAFLFTASNVPAALGARWRRCGSSRSDEGRGSWPACSPTPTTCATGCASSASRSSSTRRRRRRTPIIPVLVEDDWKAVAALARALRRRRVRQRRDPPGGAARAARCCARASWRRTTRRRSTGRSTSSRRQGSVRGRARAAPAARLSDPSLSRGAPFFHLVA